MEVYEVDWRPGLLFKGGVWIIRLEPTVTSSSP